MASGFTLVFGLMRNVNLAHGSLYLFGAYVGWFVGEHTGSWLLAVAAGFLAAAVLGLLLQVTDLPPHAGPGPAPDAGDDRPVDRAGRPDALGLGRRDLHLRSADAGSTARPTLPLVEKFPTYRLFVLLASIVIGVGLWCFLARTRVGMMIRAGVDDRDMLAASGVNVQLVFAVTFAIGAGLAGLAGVVGGTALSISPGEDTRYLLASLVVVIVGGMGSVVGAAIGALLIGLAEQFGLAYAPTYSVVFTFVIMVVALAFRPRGIMGKSSMSAAPLAAGA